MTIPDDIMKAAESALQQSSGQIFRGDAVAVIAQALAVERERCAKVAEEFAKSLTEPPSCRPDDEIEAWKGKQIACIFIAATIRNGEQP